MNPPAMIPRQVRGDPAAIWLRRPRETTAAYCAFLLYREQPPAARSIRKVAASLGRGRRVLEEWSRKHDWVARADAYTDHLDRIALAAHEDDIVLRRREENEAVFEIARQLRLSSRSM